MMFWRAHGPSRARRRDSDKRTSPATRTRYGLGLKLGLRFGLALGLGISIAGCGVDEGFVELNWAFLDATSAGLTYPQGDLEDTCALPGLDALGQPTTFALSVRLTIERADCEADCVVRETTFGCERLRGSITDVPDSGGEPYVMSVRALVTPSGADPFEPVAECLATPGPRYRAVEAGRTVDLQVVQFMVSGLDLSADPAEAGYLDLAACAPT